VRARARVCVCVCVCVYVCVSETDVTSTAVWVSTCLTRNLWIRHRQSGVVKSSSRLGMHTIDLTVVNSELTIAALPRRRQVTSQTQGTETRWCAYIHIYIRACMCKHTSTLFTQTCERAAQRMLPTPHTHTRTRAQMRCTNLCCCCSFNVPTA
jgi:hypothetical protein